MHCMNVLCMKHMLNSLCVYYLHCIIFFLFVAWRHQVFEAAIRWLDYSPQRKDGRVDTILRTIKFPLVENSYLMDTVSSNKYLAGDRGRELLNAAILYHTVPSRRHLLPTYQVSCCHLQSVTITDRTHLVS